MKKLADYFHLWPESARAGLQKLGDVRIQEDVDSDPPAKGCDDVVVVANGAKTKTLLRLLGQGYRHVVQQDRPDFAFALLSAAVLVKQPGAFHKNPVGSAIQGAAAAAAKPIEFAEEWRGGDDAAAKVEAAMAFLASVPKTRAFMDHFRLILDEMSSNAVKDARTPETSGCLLRIAATGEKIAIAMSDRLESFPEKKIRDRLRELSRMRLLEIRPDEDSGAGIGIPFMIESSTDFYLSHINGGSGVTVCVVDVKKGLKSLQTVSKNVHLFAG